jgi:hypothetical protein
VNTNQYDRKDDRLFKLFADAEYIRPREGVLKNAIEKRFVNRTTGSRPGINNQQQTKFAVGIDSGGRVSDGTMAGRMR